MRGKMDFRRKFSLKHLLCLLYLLALLLLIALLAKERRLNESPFSLSSATATTTREGDVLTFQGRKFPADLKGPCSASNLVNDKALLWHLLDGTSTKSVDATEHFALVSCFGNKLISLNLSELDLPQFLGSIELPANIVNIKIINDMALVAMERHAGIALVNLQDPAAMNLVTIYPLAGLVTSMLVDRNTVYFANMYGGLGRIDLSAETPVLQELVSLESPWRMALQGSKLAVGTMKGNVHLFNLPDEGSPVEVGRLVRAECPRGCAD